MSRKLIVAGTVIDRHSEAGIEAATIEVAVRDGGCRGPLATTTTGPDGAFQVEVDAVDSAALEFHVLFDGQPFPLERTSARCALADGRVEVAIALERFEPTPPRQEIAGRVRQEQTGYPVAAVGLSVYASAPSGRRGEVLASTLTDQSGRFVVPLDDQDGKADFRVLVDPAETGVDVAIDVRAADLPATLELIVPAAEEPVSAETWTIVGQWMGETGVTQLHELVRQLILPAPQSVFGGWSSAQRHAIIAELEHAFLDPAGVLTSLTSVPRFRDLQNPGAWDSFQDAVAPHLEDPAVKRAFDSYAGKILAFIDLRQVDWVIAGDHLLSGDVGGAVTANEGAYMAGSDHLLPGTPMDVDLVGYRDYLRDVWVGAATRDYSLSIADEPVFADAPSAIKALEARFHQGFTTVNTQKKPVNKLLIPIIKSVLTKPTGPGYGFGVAPSVIQAQGDRTPREYLDYLVGVSGVSVGEVENRYRIDLGRGDDVFSSPVQENVATLQGFLTDTHQSPAEPHPIISPHGRGYVPFYLQYEEWLWAKRPFFGENLYSPRRPLDLRKLTEEDRKYIVEYKTTKEWTWVPLLFELESALEAAQTQVQRGQYRLAADRYQVALRLTSRIPWYTAWQELEDRKARTVNDADDVRALAETRPDRPTGSPFSAHWDEWLQKWRSDLLTAAGVAHLFTIPAGLAEVALRLGEYEVAVDALGYLTGFHVGMAWPQSPAGYPADATGGASTYLEGTLPYTSGRPGKESPRTLRSSLLLKTVAQEQLGYPFDTFHQARPQHPVEAAYFRLRHGQAMLEFAEALFRMDEPDQTHRARELFKAVLWLHGETPGLSPTWSPSPWLFVMLNPNPARTSQTALARLRLAHIGEGLNYLGYAPDHVPVLRYRPLREAADRLAALAKAAQQDFLVAMERIEARVVEGLETSTMLKKATLQGRIAEEQQANAQVAIQAAQRQVKAVEKAIEAKKKEIEDHDSLLGQFKDYVGGLKKTFDDLKDSDADVDTALIMASLQSGAGLSGMTGYGLFIGASYMSMTAMADAANQRNADLKTLRYEILPAAKAQVGVRQREAEMAKLQGQVAQADADLAAELLRYQQLRFLSLEFWTHVAEFMRRLLRRYLELGAGAAWLAQRALVYEQDREIDIVRFDYFPVEHAGVTGADLLQLHLAELEMARLEGAAAVKPLKHTFSLARDFPLAFGQLKQSGACQFRTEEAPLQRAHPGMYGLRIRAVDVRTDASSSIPEVRGLIRNEGVSRVSRLGLNGDQSHAVSVRPADATPLSEFSLAVDGGIHGNPGEALAPFEGSGVDTFWSLELPALANPHGLAALADVLITLHVDARYSAQLYEEHNGAAPTVMRRYVFVSAAKHDAVGLKGLVAGEASATLTFDVSLLDLPTWEKNRTVTNLVCFLSGTDVGSFQASVGIAQPALSVQVTFEDGAVFSNAPPFTQPGSSVPLSPLNLLVGKVATQVFTLSVDAATNPAVNFSGVTDVVFGVEYEATLV